MTIDLHHRAALLALVSRLADTGVVWALTGSLGHRLQGAPVEVHDIDVQTDEAGAYRIADALKDAVVRPVELRAAGAIRSHFGEFRLEGLKVEVMGAMQKQLPDGSWEPPVDVAAHRVFVDFEGHRLPVLSLDCEWQAYERLGRRERAALLRQHTLSRREHAQGETC